MTEQFNWLMMAFNEGTKLAKFVFARFQLYWESYPYARMSERVAV